MKVHEQTKVESGSKYPVRLTGLILFNGYLNKGVADNTDLPAFALKRRRPRATEIAGATLRQTILGVEGFGPRIAGARTSANVNIDFFQRRLQQLWDVGGRGADADGSMDLDWEKDSVQVGMVTPLISPLAPSSLRRWRSLRWRGRAICGHGRRS